MFGTPVVECGVEFGSFGADGDIAIGHLYVETAEEGREEVAPHIVGKLPVERGRVFQKVNECVDLVDAVLDALHGARELLGDGSLLERDVLESLAKLLHRQGAVGGELDKALLLIFELLELFAQRVLFLLVGGLQIDQGAAHLTTDFRDVGRVEAFCGYQPTDLIFELVEPGGGHRTVAALLCGADVVLVDTAVPLVLAIHEPA